MDSAAGPESQGSRLTRAIETVGRAVAREDDNEDERLRKAVMTFSVYLICFGGIFWGTIYGAIGLWWPALIPFTYTGLSLLNIAVLYRTKRDRFFSLSQLVLILLLPFLLQWSAGGFVPSGAVMLWAILAPVGALMFHGVRESVWWWLAYLALVILSATLDVPLRPAEPEIPDWAIAVFFASNVVLVSSILFLVLRHFVAETERAKQVSDSLLHHTLPESIVDRLKAGESPIADRLDDVAIVFADIVGFTPLSESMEPEELIKLLDSIYAEFDALADDLGMEKIRTVGDAYIVVAGLPTPRPDAALVAAEMALRMRDVLTRYRSPSTHVPIEMRFGVHCGPVVAGVIGSEKLNYEVWGDTVNIASRMESTSLPGEIQLSQAMFDMVRDHYRADPRGEMEIKGKGIMSTYLLRAREPELAVPD